MPYAIATNNLDNDVLFVLSFWILIINYLRSNNIIALTYMHIYQQQQKHQELYSS